MCYFQGLVTDEIIIRHSSPTPLSERFPCNYCSTTIRIFDFVSPMHMLFTARTNVYSVIIIVIFIIAFVIIIVYIFFLSLTNHLLLHTTTARIVWWSAECFVNRFFFFFFKSAVAMTGCTAWANRGNSHNGYTHIIQ